MSEEAAESNVLTEKSSILNALRNITVEVPLFISFFTYALTGSLFTNQVIYKTCTNILNHDAYNCSQLGTENETDAVKRLETEVQSYASMILMTKALIEAIFPSVLSLFLGPWSDKHGRKSLMIASCAGSFFYYLIWWSFCQFDYLSPWYLIVASIPISLSGGYLSIITGTFCYISDVTTVENRSMRIMVLEAAIYLGTICGAMLTSYLFAVIGYSYVILIAGLFSLLSLIFTMSCITESLESAVSDGICGIFDCSLVIDMVKTCIKQRRNYDRTIIWLSMLACAITIFEMHGSNTVTYLFTRKALSWDLRDFTLYDAYSIVVAIVGILISAYIFQKCLKVSDSAMTMVSYASNVMDSAIKALATHGWEMYLAASVTLLRGVASPLTRSILSKIVPKDDVGKVFSLTTSLESIIPLMAPTIYTLLYKATITTFPGAFFLVTAGLALICFLLQGFVSYLFWKYPPREEDSEPLVQEEYND